MKPCLTKLGLNPQHSFNVMRHRGESLINKYHYHTELEMVLMKGTQGYLQIFDQQIPFTDGDVILIGSSVPHEFVHTSKNDTECDGQAEAVVAQFSKSFVGNGFLQLAEMEGVPELLNRAGTAWQLTGSLKEEVTTLMEQMAEASDIDRLFLQIAVLSAIANSNEYFVFDTNTVYAGENVNKARIETIYRYTQSHYFREITINEIARQIGLTKESFCRFFKKTTRTSYFQYLIEFRIGKACTMLRESDLTVKEVAYKCGYDNLSNFHHQFKKVTSLSPLQYQNGVVAMEHQHSSVAKLRSVA